MRYWPFFLLTGYCSGQQTQATTPTTKTTKDVFFFFRLHHLGSRICRRVSCNSNSEPPFNHCLYKEQKSSHSQDVLGYKFNRSGHVGWRSWRSVLLFKVPAWKSCDFAEFYPVVPLISLTNITVISLERMHATFRPLRHRLVKRWVYVVAIAVVWVLPGIAAGLEKERKILKICVNFLWEAHSILCLFVIFASYTSIFLKFRFRAHPQRHFAANLRQKKLTVTLFITTLVSLLMWLPYNIFKFLSITSNGISHSTTRLLNADLFFVLLFFANSLVNPILYTVRMPEFKKALFSLFRRQQRQNVTIPPHWY